MSRAQRLWPSGCGIAGVRSERLNCPLISDMIGQLAFEAAFRNVSIGEFIGELIVTVVKQETLQMVSVRDSFRGAGRVTPSHSRQEHSIASRD